MKNKINIPNKWRMLFVLFVGLFLCNPLTTSAESGFASNENEALTDNTNQQQIEVNGTVTDSRTGDPLPGVNIVVEGTTTGTTTDMDGNYTLEVPADAKLVFSFVGYQERSVNVRGREEINIKLKQSVTELEEVVAVGYGTQTKEQVTGAVSTVSSEDLADVPETATSQALQGQLSGVTVRKSHVPGGEADVRIRGMTTINNNDPLWVVDGVPGAGAPLPNEIESISVLKGASATAIYGARGAGGVILATTKSGEKGQETEVNFSMTQGMNRAKDFYNMLNTQEMAELYWLEQKNAGVDPENISHPLYGSGTEPDIPEYVVPPRADPSTITEEYIENNYDRRQSDEDGDGTHLISRASVPGTDWFDVVSQMGWYQKYNLNVSGGSESTNFGIMAGYLNEEAYVKYSDFERFNLRLNADHDLTDWLTIGERLKVTHSQDKGMKNARGSEGSIIAWCYRAQPIIPVYDVKGHFMGSKVPETGNAENPLANLYRARNNFGRDLSASGNFNVQANIIEGLSFKSLLGFDLGMSNSKWYGYRNREDTEASKNESVGRYSGESRNWNWSNTLNYAKSFGSHRIDIMAGTEAVENTYYNLSGNRQAYFSPDYMPSTPYMVLDAGTEAQSNSGDYSSWSTFSMFGRFNYTYGDRYILNATFRRDGSSRFGSENRYGNFPAFSLGWRVTEESFMEGTASWLDYLKIRGGWGLVGNDRIGNYNGYTTFNMSSWNAIYPLAGGNVGGVAGIQSAAFGNPEARWESTETINVGVQSTIFDVLDVNIDVWEKNTSDMLYPATIPAVMGDADIPSVNIAEMKNRGFDLELGVTTPDDNQGEFTYDISLNISHYKNEVKKLTGAAGEKIWSSELRHMRYARAEAGTEFPEFYGYVVDGIFQSEQEAENHPNAFGETGTYNQEGRFKYKDVNGDNVIDEDDRTYIGSPHPDFTAGLNIRLRYGNFDFTSLLYSSYGNDIVNYARRFLDFHMFQGGRSERTLYESYGSPYLEDNSNAKMPVYEPEDSKSQRPSTYFVEDGSYLRMNNLELGYTLPDNLTNRLDMNRVRIYARATNLFTITGYSGLDPEIYTEGINLGQDRGSWPTPQQIMFGINVNM